VQKPPFLSEFIASITFPRSKQDLSEYLRTQKRKNLKLAFTTKAFTLRSLPPQAFLKTTYH
jgi:hypothetical protein